MKIQITDSEYSATIESAEDGVNITQAVEMVRAALVGSGYHPDSVAAHLPSEEELDQIIADILNSF
tara:strand:+ start:708 stop:905 length:198 start_codon:yes stop_codon:yes gene_type:complete